MTLREAGVPYMAALPTPCSPCPPVSLRGGPGARPVLAQPRGSVRTPVGTDASLPSRPHIMLDPLGIPGHWQGEGPQDPARACRPLMFVKTTLYDDF